jgi:hypothetical protein
MDVVLKMNDICNLCKKQPINKERSINRCTNCLNKANNYLKQNPEKAKRYAHTRYLNNKNVILAKGKIYDLLHPEVHRKSNKKYRQSHINSIKERNIKYRKEHKERYNEVNRKWKKEHPEKGRKQTHDHRAKIRNATGKFTIKEWNDLCKLYNNRCLWCGSNNKKLTMDHVVPLVSGGTNYISNIQPLCMECNAKKHTKTIDFRPFGNIILDWT